MKKRFLLICLISIVAGVNAGETTSAQKPTPQQIQQIKQARAQAFEQRLGLTEQQKVKAREIRIKGHEMLRPVVVQIVEKKQEARMVKMSRMAVQMQEEKLAVIDAEIRVLEKKANDIRRANMKEFESILTRQQKKTLKQMKKEGRQKYHSEHPALKQPQAFGVKQPR